MLATGLALVVGSAMPAAAASSELDAPARVVDTAAVQSELGAIAARYTEVGDVLSAADATFVRKHAATAPAKDVLSLQGTARGSFSRLGRGAGGSGSVSGSYSMTTSEFTVNNSYRFAYTARGTGAVTKIRACAHVRAYGLVGSGGVGVVFAEDPCSTTKGKTNSFSRGRSYTAFAAYTTMQYDARFYTPSGSFQIAN